MNESKTSQTEDSGPVSREIRDRNALLISHRYDFNRSSSANKNTDLSSDFVRKIGEKAGEFGSKNLFRRDPPSVNMFDPFNLIRF